MAFEFVAALGKDGGSRDTKREDLYRAHPQGKTCEAQGSISYLSKRPPPR